MCLSHSSACCRSDSVVAIVASVQEGEVKLVYPHVIAQPLAPTIVVESGVLGL